MGNTEQVNMLSKGYYSLSVVDADNNVRKKIPYTANVVTYNGAYTSLIGAGGASPMFSANAAGIGTGTVERTRSSNDLGILDPGLSSTATASRPGNEVDNLDGTSTLTLTREMSFALGEKVGTFSEIGIYDGSALIAGQLIKDELGNPTTITILADEQLIVTYTLEWTVPNTSKLIGTGTVEDSALNSYNYEVWAQPYFSDYTINSVATATRYFQAGFSDEIIFRDSLGTTDYGITVDTGTGWSGRVSHDGSGTVTATTEPYLYSPTQFSATDIVFIGFYSTGGTASGSDITDTGIALTSSETSVNVTPAVVLKFLNPITKTTNDSFSIQASITIVV